MAVSYSGAKIDVIGVVYTADTSKTLDEMKILATDAANQGNDNTINRDNMLARCTTTSGNSFVYHLTVSDRSVEIPVKAIGFVRLENSNNTVILTSDLLTKSYSELS